jgi:hypothetical protein
MWREAACAACVEMLVELDGCRPTGWLRTHRGDVALEHQPWAGPAREERGSCQRISHRLMTASGLSELSVRQLRSRRRRLAGGLSEPERTLRGVLLSEGRACSSGGCRCHRGELHGPYAYLAVYADGRSRTIYVPQSAQALVEQHVAATQRNEALLAEIAQINLELLRRRALG